MAKKTTTTELINQIAQEQGCTRQTVRDVIRLFACAVGTELLHGNSVAVSGLGTFKPTHRAARKGRNPQTGETIDIAASNGVGFSAAKVLKDTLN